MINKKRDDTATLTAEAHGCSAQYVRQLIRGDRNTNTERAKAIIGTYNNILEAKRNLSKPAESPTE
jgi:hypothetical protein